MTEKIDELTLNEPGGDSISGQAPPKGKPYVNLSRALLKEDLGTIGVQKMLLNEIDRLEHEKSVSEKYRDSFHEKDKVLAVSEEKLEQETSVNLIADISFGAFISIGTAIMSLGDPLTEDPNWSVVVVGSIMMLVGIAVKVVQRK